MIHFKMLEVCQSVLNKILEGRWIYHCGYPQVFAEDLSH